MPCFTQCRKQHKPCTAHKSFYAHFIRISNDGSSFAERARMDVTKYHCPMTQAV